MTRDCSLLAIGLNGASWDAWQPWLDDGVMPALASLRKSGLAGVNTGVLPTFVPPNWASFWTGQTPAQHCIFAFTPLEPHGRFGVLGSRALSGRSWRELAISHDRRFLAVCAPLTDAAAAAGGDSETGAAGRPPEARELIQRQVRALDRTVTAAADALRQSAPDVAVIYLSAVDAVQHALWHGIQAEHPHFDPRIREQLAEFFSVVDASLASLMEAARAETVLVFSDHGFMDCYRIFNLAGALFSGRQIRLRGPLIRLARALPRRILRRASPSPVRHWFHAVTDSRVRIYLEHKALYVTGPEAAAESVANTLIDVLAALTDPATGRRVLSQAAFADSLYGPLRADGWRVIVLDPAHGYTVRRGHVTGPLFRECRPNLDYMIGTHTRQGLYVLSGPGIAAGERDISMLDLAPTILQGIGVPVPRRMSGSPLQSMTTPA